MKLKQCIKLGLTWMVVASLSSCVINETKQQVSSCLDCDRWNEFIEEYVWQDKQVIFLRQFHASFDSNFNECLSEKWEKNVLISQNNIFESLVKYNPDYLIIEWLQEWHMEHIRWSIGELVKTLFIDWYTAKWYNKYLLNKEKYKDRLTTFLWGALTYGILYDVNVLPWEPNLESATGAAQLSKIYWESYSCQDISDENFQEDIDEEDLITGLLNNREEYVISQIQNSWKYAIVYGWLHDFQPYFMNDEKWIKYQVINTHPWFIGKSGIEDYSEDDDFFNAWFSPKWQNMFDIWE